MSRKAFAATRVRKRELVDGEIIVMPPPDFAHSRVAKQILLLFLYARQGDQVIRHAVEREYRSDAAQATFSLAEISS